MAAKEEETAKDPADASANAASAHDKKKTKIRVAVGSKNPVKVNAVKRALEKALERSSLDVDLEVKGFDVPSRVPDQPFGDVSCSYKINGSLQNALRFGC